MIERIPIESRDQDRFERLFIPEPMSGCWLWMGHCFVSGYGFFATHANGRRKHLRAHRVSFELYRGPIPEGLHVLHRCDTPACVNPEHLFLGTHADNMQDCVLKGRRLGMSGSDNPAAKLTASQALAIRRDPRSGAAIARTTGLSPSQVRRIKRGEAWPDVR